MIFSFFCPFFIFSHCFSFVLSFVFLFFGVRYIGHCALKGKVAVLDCFFIFDNLWCMFLCPECGATVWIIVCYCRRTIVVALYIDLRAPACLELNICQSHSCHDLLIIIFVSATKYRLIPVYFSRRSPQESFIPYRFGVSKLHR